MQKVIALLAAFARSAVGKLILQACAAFLVTFGGQLVASGWFDIHHVTDMTIVQKAAVAGLAAGIAVVRSFVAALVSGGQSVTLLDAYRVQRAARLRRKAAA